MNEHLKKAQIELAQKASQARNIVRHFSKSYKIPFATVQDHNQAPKCYAKKSCSKLWTAQFRNGLFLEKRVFAHMLRSDSKTPLDSFI
jgi:fructose/tagatose bisphosphate aldolase